MTLPRGLPGQSPHAPTATARWASAAEIARYQFQPGDIFLGYLPVPSEAAHATLARLDAFEKAITADPDLTTAWKDATLVEARRHARALAATDRIPIGVHDDRQMLTEAGTRSGKGTSQIVSNLCLYPGSVLCIDPKGENARLTAARRGPGSAACDGMGQQVAVLDPFNVSRVSAALRGAWNPLDQLRADDEAIISHAASIAAALVVPSKAEDAHFDESARIFIEALILYVALEHEGRDTRTLITVYDLLMRGVRDPKATDTAGNTAPVDLLPFSRLLWLMEQDARLEGVIAAAASMLSDMGDRELGSVLSTARRNLEWLKRPEMRRVVSHSTIKDLAQLKTAGEGMSLFLCLPPHRMGDCGRWLRLVISSALERLYEVKEAPATGYPVLFLLEEFPTLRHMENIEIAAGYAAGFGLKLWVIVQDLAQLKRWYKDGWETFVGNAGVIQAFGNSDATTLEYLSARLGQIEVSQSVLNTTTSLTASSNDPGEFQRAANVMQNRGQASLLTNPLLAFFNPQSTGQSATTTSAVNQQIQRTPLILPDEIERHFRREAMNQCVMIKGERPFELARANYFETPEFFGLFEPDREPFHTKEQAAEARRELLAQRARDARTAIEAAEAFINQTNAAIAAAKNGKKGR